MAINGAVWITSGNSILKFTNGWQESFRVSGLKIPFGDRLRVYAHDDLEYVYVLDQVNKRVVSFAKDGMYHAEYTWNSDFAPSDLIVSESRRTLLFLLGSGIYKAELL